MSGTQTTMSDDDVIREVQEFADEAGEELARRIADQITVDRARELVSASAWGHLEYGLDIPGL
jgi:hypothetical protein